MDGRFDRRSLLRAGGTALLAGVAGCLGFGPAETERASRSFDTDGPLVVESHNGDVTVRSGDDDQVRVESVERTSGPASLLEDVSIEGFERNDGFRVAPAFDSDRARRRVAVDLTIAVPDGVALARAHTENGDVTARDFAGDPTLETLNGDVRAEDVAGAVRATTVNGDVTATGCDAVARAVSTNGDVEVEVLSAVGAAFETTNGDVEVAVDPGVDAHVVLRTGNGEVTVEGVTLRGGTTRARHAEGDLDDGGPTLRARSENGDVTLSSL